MEKTIYAEAIKEQSRGFLTMDTVIGLIEKPKFKGQGDMAFPCFALAKTMHKAPQKIAEEIAVKIEHPLFEKVVADGPYINCFLQKETVSKKIVEAVLAKGSSYGSHSFGKGKSIAIDFSSPNIAKPFSMGHLRSTVIGNSLAHIAEKCGYTAVRINHLGDWGTQFGKLIAAYRLWGNEEDVRKAPIKELLALYVKFHKEAEKDPSLNEAGRLWFKKLEEGNEEAKRLWKWFRDESLQEFSKIYGLLGVEFDSTAGEAFYNDKMERALELLDERNLLASSQGAEVVDLEESGLPPMLAKKSDGATLYATRDLAAALYRQEQYGFSKAWYVVGFEQTLHFKQLFLVLQKMGFDWAQEMIHIPFGFVLKGGKKMSTRKGEVVLLEEVLSEAIRLAERNIEEKNSFLADKQQVARMVGVGAVIFHDLKNDRQTNVEFSLEDMLKFEGTTGPYVQYTHARACSVLRKSSIEIDAGASKGLADEASWAVAKLLMEFPSITEKSFHQNEPSAIAKYVLELSQEFNKYYSQVKILADDAEQESRLALVKAVTIVLSEGLRLLGMKAPSEM
ncbi:arginine--tRNA ligase [Planomicrobium sp. CPCC 101110]|uniref:arginine--tRNA ligase n=1 Tax=Planomicrobium sp. CPCC 101110 TaxID=2599619 RepID=UPI0011B6892B|nr:arginine--tRNA ligase [Planomicrobium sp. CPCC 101110]TWT28133.1 arginine--tRNA ligase [Planomicrobium sp. CPCC 101110]